MLPTASTTSYFLGTAALTIFSFIIALAVTILALIFIVPEKCRAKLNGFGKFLHDICNFKFMIVEKILQFLYIFATAYVIIMGFFSLFSYNTYTGWTGYIGFIVIIFGPIAIRISYELLMMVLIAVKNIIQINNKLKNQNDDNSDKEDFGTLDLNQYMSAKPATAKFCSKCGSRLSENGTCPNCNQ